ncbi:MAG: hypothetical protein HYX94_06330 [Chloroflexi bacterium]|nr:hypothetical protein [Chloroflexota bacterium]
MTVDFTNYQLGPQPDSLFELPPGTKVIDLPSNLLGMPGSMPTPGR